MKFVSYARLWHRIWTMRLSLLGVMYTAAAGAWATLPRDWMPHIPERWRVVLALIGCAIPALTAAASVIDQKSLSQPDPPPNVGHTTE